MDKPRVGVGIFVFKDRKVLLNKRKGSRGNGTWSIGGGALDFGESLVDCGKREMLEEAGIVLKNVRIAFFKEDVFENEHWVNFYLMAEIESGEPRVMEPEKCDGWGWFDWNDLPKPIFEPVQNLIDEGFNPFE